MNNKILRLFIKRSLFLALMFLVGPLFCNYSMASSMRGEITLYTSQPEGDIQCLVEAFNKMHKNISVNIFRSGTVEVLNKLKAELMRGHSKADIVLISDAISMESLKQGNHLFAYKKAKVQYLPNESYDRDKMYFGTKYIYIGIVCHEKLSTRPTSWIDLTKEDFKNKIIMPDPRYSGAALTLVMTLAQNAQLGWAFFKNLKANGAQLALSNGAVLNAVLRGEKSVGIIVDFMAHNAKNRGAPIVFVYPSEGSPIIMEPIAILRASPNKPCAKIFVDFVLSVDGQKISELSGYQPVLKEGIGLENTIVPRSMPCPYNDPVNSLKASKEAFGEIFE